MLLRNRILDHWYEFRPTLVRDLERSGELAAVVAALEQTILEKQAVMLKKGLSLEQADELLRPMWMISDDDRDCPCAPGCSEYFGRLSAISGGRSSNSCWYRNDRGNYEQRSDSKHLFERTDSG